MAARQWERIVRVLAGFLAASVLLVLVSHLILARRFNTEHLQQQLEAGIRRKTDSLYTIRIGSSRLSLLGRSWLVSGFELFPDTAMFTRRGKAGPVPSSRYVLHAASFRATGIGLLHFLRKRISLDSANIDSLNVRISIDNTKPSEPPDTVRLPHQSFQDVRRFLVGRLRIEHSDLQFSERDADGTRFGTLRFAELSALLTNVTNDPGLMTPATPCEIDFRALLGGAGPLVLRMKYDLSAPSLNLTYQGSIGHMDARAFNSMLVSYKGYRIRSGELDSVDFQVDVRADTARGSLTLLYHDLEVETLDKSSRGRDLKDVLQTFFFNTFKLKSKNPSHDEPARVASLWHPRTPQTPLLRFIWQTVRDGVFKTIGI
jgi:hypothetical protein